MNLLLTTDSLKYINEDPNWAKEHYLYLSSSEIVLFYGLQYYLKKYLSGSIDADQITDFMKAVRGILGTCSLECKDRIGVGVVDDRRPYDQLAFLGYLPLEILALPEGSIVPPGTRLLQIKNTLPGFTWLVSYIEASLLRVRAPILMATKSFHLRKMCQYWAEITSDDLKKVETQVNDFGQKNYPSEELAEVLGSAHLINFRASDSILASKLLDKYYQATDAAECLLPETVIVTNLTELITQISKRNGKIVFQPEDTLLELFGDPNANEGTARNKGALNLLWDAFGGACANSKGYRVLSLEVDLVLSTSPKNVEMILMRLKDAAYATTNVRFRVDMSTVEVPMQNFQIQHEFFQTGFSEDLQLVYRDGEFFNTSTLDQIRTTAHPYQRVPDKIEFEGSGLSKEYLDSIS